MSHDNITCSLAEVTKLLPMLLNAKIVPFLHSSPGIGKSALSQQLAKKANLKFIDLRLTDMDPSDLSGLPFFKDGVAKFIPFDTFPLSDTPLPKDANGKPMNGWLISLEEFNSASQATQAAAYKLVLDRMVGNHHLHDSVYMIASGNLESDNAIVNEMSSALISRFAHFYIDINHKDWMDWAATARVDMRIRSYLGFRPSHLYTFDPDTSSPYGCPRTWAMLSKTINGKELDREHLPLLASLVGQGVAVEFLAFLRLYSKLPDFAEIEANPTTVNISNDLAIQWALMGMVTQHITEDNAQNICKFLRRLSMELQVCAMREIMAIDKNLLETKLKDWMLELAKEIF